MSFNTPRSLGSLTRLVREARGGDAEAVKVANDCPLAAERLKAP